MDPIRSRSMISESSEDENGNTFGENVTSFFSSMRDLFSKVFSDLSPTTTDESENDDHEEPTKGEELSLSFSSFISICEEMIFSISAPETKLKTPEEILAQILEQIDQLKEKNQKTEEILNNIKKFVEQDQQLLSKFEECLTKTKEILLPPPKKINSRPVGHPVVEQLRLETQRMNDLEKIKRRFNDFLEKNREFLEILIEKCELFRNGWANQSQSRPLTICYEKPPETFDNKLVMHLRRNLDLVDFIGKRRRAFGKGRKYKIEKIKQKLTGVFRGKVVNF